MNTISNSEALPPTSGSRTLRRMATQVGEMLCVSPETGNKLGIWTVSPEGAIGLGAQDGSEFWILESILHESSEIEVKGLPTRDDWESTSEQLARVQRSLDSLASATMSGSRSLPKSNLSCQHLKTWPKYFDAVERGTKTFDIRSNDRPFMIGQRLVLHEYDPDEDKFTGRTVERRITYMTDWEQKPGFVVLAIKPLCENAQVEALQ